MSRLGLGYGYSLQDWRTPQSVLDELERRRQVDALIQLCQFHGCWWDRSPKETPMSEPKITDAHVSRFIEALQKNLARVDVAIDHMTDNMSVGGLRINRSEIRAALEAAMIDGPRPRTNAELHEAIAAAGPHGVIQVTRDELDRIRQWPAPQPILHHHRRKDDPK